MKIRGLVILFIAAAVVFVAFVFWLKERQAVPTPLAASSTTSIAQPANTVQNTPMLTNAPLPQPAAGVGTVASQPKSLLPNDKAGLIKEVLQGNDADVKFYGRLEDQSSNAVSGAQVDFSIQYENPDARGIQRGQVVSDDNGFFTISGYKGQDLGIMPKKVGYALATTETYFRYSQLTPGYFIPDANNPTVIRMWKLQGAQPLIGINKTYKLPYTDAPMLFDLVAGNVVSTGGDLEVIVTRAAGTISQRNRADWSIELVPVNGGIMETDYQTAQVTFEAPSDGYQTNYLVQMNHDDPNWFSNIQKVFFLTSRDGQVYSKFSFDFGINGDPNGTMWFQFKGVANANGSGNWEPTEP